MEHQGLQIGQLAKRSGVSADTIRYYERIGLMPKPARTPAATASTANPPSGECGWYKTPSGSGFRSNNWERFSGFAMLVEHLASMYERPELKF